MLRNKKRGYFFVIDAFIGSAIIFLALFVIFNSDVKATKIQHDYSIAEDYSTFILNTQIRDLNNPYVNKLVSNGIIYNTENTIMEQVTQFYYNANVTCGADALCTTANMTLAHDLIQNITDPLIPQKYGFKYTIKDSGGESVIYSRGNDSFVTNTIINSQKLTFLQINTTTLYGPKIVEIRIWI